MHVADANELMYVCSMYAGMFASEGVEGVLAQRGEAHSTSSFYKLILQAHSTRIYWNRRQRIKSFNEVIGSLD